MSKNFFENFAVDQPELKKSTYREKCALSKSFYSDVEAGKIYHTTVFLDIEYSGVGTACYILWSSVIKLFMITSTNQLNEEILNVVILGSIH